MIALDLGAGNLKVYGEYGGIVMPSQVASSGDGVSAGEAVGLRSARKPASVRLNGHRFYAGLGAHNWGRPIENLDDGRFITGAPELRAMIYAAISEYRTCGPLQNTAVWVGLPQSSVTPSVISSVREWLKGDHDWWYANDGESERDEFFRAVDVVCTSQAAGALFDFLLDDEGRFIPERKALFKREIGIVSIGMNTIEMLVVESGVPKERFTASSQAGVRRLLELADSRGLWSRGELDTQLRSGSLPVADAVPIWSSEVVGEIERKWGKASERFAAVVIVGGGALLLGPSIQLAFNGKANIADDPLISIARGIYKMALQREKKR